MIQLLRRFSFTLAVALPAALTACGSDGGTTAPAVSIEQTTFAPALNVNLAAMTRTQAGVYRRDLTVGTGAIVVRSQNLGVRYTGWLANGTQFDSNAGAGPLFNFRLGAGQVIAGWDDGLDGIRVGGRRQLIIPPALGYGASGNGPIPGNAVLVFEVQVVSAQ